MQGITRQQLISKAQDVILEYGVPCTGIRTKKQLIKEVAKCLSTFDIATVYYMNGEFKVTPDAFILGKYPVDFTVIGDAIQEEWYTPEQIKALHELAFGYQF